MMKYSKLALLLTTALILILTAQLGAINSNAGTSAYAFLKIGVGARAVALGNAYVGLAEDETAIYYNPAGLSQIQGKALSSGYHNYLADIQGGYLSAVFPWGQKRNLGVSINYLNYGSTPRTNQNGEIIDEFGGGDMALTVAFSQIISDRFSVGLAGKFIYESIDSFSSTGMAIDLGLLYKFQDEHTSLGLAVSNLGFQLSGLSAEHKDDLPIMFKVGLAHRMHNAPFLVVADAGKPSDNDFFAGGGVEF